MLYTVLGILGFVIIHLSDPVAIRRLPMVKPIVWTIGIGLLAYATVMVGLSPNKFDLPAWTTWLGWILFAGSLTMMSFSLFINLPFRKTYLARGVGDRLVTTGMYAMVRHPGVPCAVLFIVAFVMVSRSWTALMTAPLFIVLDILLVIIQDRFYFVRMFPGYEEYRRQTPMLIPNARSLGAFIDSLRQAKIRARTQEAQGHVRTSSAL
jgi:protein-S-isoprenylcysteine O-methyltransferase Ste14